MSNLNDLHRIHTLRGRAAEPSAPTIDTLTAVGTALLKHSDVFVGSTVEYPGYVAVETDGGGSWAIGTANGVWGADLRLFGGGFDGDSGDWDTIDRSVATDIPQDCTDVERIAGALFAAMASEDTLDQRRGFTEPSAPLDTLDIVSRALSVIVESDGADEHAELIAELRAVVRALTVAR